MDELVKKVEAAHDKYRNSGLALMTTVVSLSSAGIYSAKTVFGVDKLTTEFLLIPIVFALLQQLLAYLGSQTEARSLNKLLEVNLKVKMATDTNRAEIQHGGAKEFSNLHRQSTRIYTWADRFCTATVLLFIMAIVILCVQGHLSQA